MKIKSLIGILLATSLFATTLSLVDINQQPAPTVGGITTSGDVGISATSDLNPQYSASAANIIVTLKSRGNNMVLTYPVGTTISGSFSVGNDSAKYSISPNPFGWSGTYVVVDLSDSITKTNAGGSLIFK